MKKQKATLLNLLVDEETKTIIKILRKDFNTNISSLIRNLLKDYYKNIKNKND